MRTTTDNASNFIKAFRVCAGDEGSITEEEREDVNDSEKDDDDLEVETEAVEVEALMEEEDECSEYQLPKHHRCLSSSEFDLNSGCQKSRIKGWLQEDLSRSICQMLSSLVQDCPPIYCCRGSCKSSAQLTQGGTLTFFQLNEY